MHSEERALITSLNLDDTWQKQLANGFDNLKELCQYLGIAINQLPILPRHDKFPLKVPRGFVECMERGNPQDPLLRQILPLRQELTTYPGYATDPVGDLAASVAAGVIHKYHGRALFIMTGACAINCRYCFRRNFPYREAQLTPQRLQAAITYLDGHKDIAEIILSGGDPLLLSDDKFAQLVYQLDKISHLKRIRIHSRIPIVLPARITSALLDCLSQCQKQIVLVVHANHANELSDTVKQACLHLTERKIPLLNQSVLLRGVNDSASVLIQLSDKLFSLGILPYYLHLLDKASGTAHFEVSQAEALAILEQVKAQLPGYLVPRLIKEEAGASSKTILS